MTTALGRTGDGSGVAASVVKAAEYLEQGQFFLADGRAREALTACTRAIELAPDNATTRVCHGLALKMLGRLEEAAASFACAIALRPDNVPALVNHAATLQQLGRSGDALVSSERAVALQPDFAPGHCNRGLALNDLGRPLEALQSYDRAISIDPDFAAAHGNRGKALQALDRPEEALLAYQRVIALQPFAAVQAHVNASHAHLTLGQFDSGWERYEWRKRLPKPLGSRVFTQPLWLGSEPLHDRRLLLHWEQGLGDTLQFCRYALVAKSHGARVALMVQPTLERLLRTLDPQIELVSGDAVPSGFDYHCPMLSAPHAFRTRLTTVPAPTPYLHAEPEFVARWRHHIGSDGFKIGINWQGNPRAPADRGRSFPPALFRDISKIPGVRLISLQVGHGAEALQRPPAEMRVETLGADFDRGGDAFVDSAAVMQCLDLIITSDTAVAHLAGALGRPTWVVLQQVPDWRWLRERSDSPWYPGMRLFRQSRRGEWTAPFERMRDEIAASTWTH